MKFFDNQEIQTETIARNYYYYFCLNGKVLVFVVLFETGSLTADQAGMKVVAIHLPQLP